MSLIALEKCQLVNPNFKENYKRQDLRSFILTLLALIKIYHKLSILVVKLRSPKYPSFYIFDVIIMIRIHENLGKKPKFRVLSCTDQKIWLLARSSLGVS